MPAAPSTRVDGAAPAARVQARAARRRFIAALPALPGLLLAPASAQPGDAAAALRSGAAALLLRHAATEPGTGDPPNYRLDDCRTQRNLSDEGRAQARRIGAWLQHAALRPAAVRSSHWCRCVDTARLAFGTAEPWDALDSFFDNRAAGPAQTLRLRASLALLARGHFEAWVTHQVNIAALTGEAVAVGEGFVIAAGAYSGSAPDTPPAVRVLARVRLG